jgi:hypothetical protein
MEVYTICILPETVSWNFQSFAVDIFERSSRTYDEKPEQQLLYGELLTPKTLI